MSWYSSPIQPIDPVVQSQTPKPPIRFMRDNFASTGQNSFTRPPAQDQSMWESLLNVQPITQGILNQRWGYDQFIPAFNLQATIPIIKITYFGGINTHAIVQVSSIQGIQVGDSITIAGNTNAAFNGTFTITSTGTPGPNFFFIAFHIGGGTITGTGGLGTTDFGVVAGNRLYDFQSDSLNTRAILVAGNGGVLAYNERGGIYNGAVFIPQAAANILRSITSRNFQYFCNGNNALDPVTHLTGDSLKWDGSTSGGVSNIGIVNSDITVNDTSGGTQGNIAGPNSATNGTDLADQSTPWSVSLPATSVFVYELVTVTEVGGGHLNIVTSNQHLQSDNLKTEGFNFPSIVAPEIAGIALNITYTATPSVGSGFTAYPSFGATMVKNDVVTGGGYNSNLIADGQVHTLTLGGATSLWGAIFSPADITNAQFGVQYYGSTSIGIDYNHITPGAANQGCTIAVQSATLTIYLGGNIGTSGSSGDGVGIVSGVAGGDINLTLGRIYYLVPNNSTTGHFGDLSTASGSTGTALSAEYNLILATYNDPQADTKYVLGTADGGDPSILYEVQVVVPGLVISSWAIDGANNVTFTGVFNGTQYVPGTTFVVGGLSHGNYMNGSTLAVTGSTPTTVTAVFTHGADSATEIGVAGNLSFSIPNNVTRVVDNTPDPDLVLDQPLVFTDTFGDEFGLTLNDPPPAGNLLIKHQGRLWMAGVSGATHSVYFSKSVAELTLPDGFIAGKYEEAWPGSNYFDVSDGAESVSGLLSDGTTLYIGTQNHIRRLIGNSPFNFQQPQIVHPETGLINQEVWQLTFMQGAPSGSIWMTPDYRVIQSDFNTYMDIGHPIQDILNNLQSTAASLAHGAFVADGEFECYILAVPYKQSAYCDTHLVFDLRSRQWFVWEPAGGSLSLLFNINQTGQPQWLFINGAGMKANFYTSTALTDNGVIIPVSATTTWMNLGEPTRRKLLNEVQVYGNPAMHMTVQGANNFGAFDNPHTVVYDRALRQSPFGVWTLYLTGDIARHRYYRFKFSASNGQVPFLGSYAISVMPMDDI